MAKIVRPALSNLKPFFKQNWREALALTVKTFALVFLITYGLKILSDILFGTGFVAEIYHIYEKGLDSNWSDFFKRSEKPDLSSLLNLPTILLELFLSIVCIWLIAPLVVSLCRTIVLGDTFEGRFFKRLTEKRCLKVALLSWGIALLLICLALGTLLMAKFVIGENHISTFQLLTLCIWIFATSYVCLRLCYLEPAFAIDRTFSKAFDAWKVTKNRAWTTFKIIFLSYLASDVASLFLSFLLRKLGYGLSHSGQVFVFGALTEIVNIFLFLLCTSLIASAYQILEQAKK